MGGTISLNGPTIATVLYFSSWDFYGTFTMTGGSLESVNIQTTTLGDVLTDPSRTAEVTFNGVSISQSGGYSNFIFVETTTFRGCTMLLDAVTCVITNTGNHYDGIEFFEADSLGTGNFFKVQGGSYTSLPSGAHNQRFFATMGGTHSISIIVYGTTIDYRTAGDLWVLRFSNSLSWSNAYALLKDCTLNLWSAGKIGERTIMYDHPTAASNVTYTIENTPIDIDCTGADDECSVFESKSPSQTTTFRGIGGAWNFNGDKPSLLRVISDSSILPDQITIVDIGGSEFLDVLSINTGALLAMGIVGLTGLTVAIPLLVYRRYKRTKREEAARHSRKRQTLLSKASEVRLVNVQSEEFKSDPPSSDALAASLSSDELEGLELEGELEQDRERRLELEWVDKEVRIFFSRFPESPNCPFDTEKIAQDDFHTKDTYANALTKSVISSSGIMLGNMASTVFNPLPSRSQFFSRAFTPVSEDQPSQSAARESHENSEVGVDDFGVLRESTAVENLDADAENDENADLSEVVVGQRRKVVNDGNVLFRPHQLDPHTWGIYLTGTAAEKPEKYRRFSLFMRKRYDTLERSRDDRNHRKSAYYMNNLSLTTLETLFDHEYKAVDDTTAPLSASWTASDVFMGLAQELLFPLELHRICKTDAEKDRFHDAYAAVTTERMLSNSGAQGGEEVSLLAEVVSRSGIKEPSESSINRALLLGLKRLLTQPPKEQRQAILDLVVAGALDPLVVADVFAEEADDQNAANKEKRVVGRFGVTDTEGSSAGSVSCGANCADHVERSGDGQDFTSRIRTIINVWQLVGLFFNGMSWPERYVTTFGGFTAILSLKFDQTLGANFAVSFYLCAVLAFLGVIVIAAIVVADSRRTVKNLEDDLRVQVEKQMALMAAGKKTSLKKSGRERIAWVALLLLKLLYVPVTRNAVIGIFCHKSIQCLYDCYNEPAHIAIFWVGIVTGILITLGVPIVYAIITKRKKLEFVEFVGDVSMHPKLEDELWQVYTDVDSSPYKGVYRGYMMDFAYFAIVLMGVNALMCFVALGTPPDSTVQAVLVTIVQCWACWTVGFAAPYINEVCNWLLFQGQTYLLFTLALNCMYRVSPDESDGPYGDVLPGGMSKLKSPRLMTRQPFTFRPYLVANSWSRSIKCPVLICIISSSNWPSSSSSSSSSSESLT